MLFYYTIGQKSIKSKYGQFQINLPKEGQKGGKENEKADELAKNGASSAFIGPEPFSVIGANTIRWVLRDNEREYWAKPPLTRKPKTIKGELDLKWCRIFYNIF